MSFLRFVLVLLALGFAGASEVAHAASPLHPEVPLLDEDGNDVLETGKPVSPMKSCGECHDTDYIAKNSYHAMVGFDEMTAPGEAGDGLPWSFSPGLFGRWDPLRYRRVTLPGEAAFDLGVADWIQRFGGRHPGGGPATTSRRGGRLDALPTDGPVDPETHVRDPETGEIVRWDWQASGVVEMNCFLCHLPDPADDARIEALESGAFAWAATATLAHTGLVKQRDDGTWRYVRDTFTDDGLVSRAVLELSKPTSKNCGICHGVVAFGPDPVRLMHGTRSWETESKGQVWSPQPVSASALNLQDKAAKTYAWDVHAERLVGCVACHPSINNPVAFAESLRSRPQHLSYEARRLSIGEYLRTPSHNFAKGDSAQGNVARRLNGSMRRCENCHNALETHESWLPYPKRHLNILLCESCHTPHVPAPARESSDWTVLTPGLEPLVTYRGVEGDADDPRSLIPGYEPVLLPRTTESGTLRHGPHNLCTSWWWGDGDPSRPVPIDRLQQAYFDDELAYRSEIVLALDLDGDGTIQRAELRLDTEAKVAAVKARLVAVGVVDPRIEGCIQPMSLHHNVLPGAFATRHCETCHASDSRITRPFELAPYVPAGAEAKWIGDANVRLAGSLYETEDGRLVFEPKPSAAGRYLIGHDRAGWIDVVGILLILGTIAGVLVHASLRGLAARARKEAA